MLLYSFKLWLHSGLSNLTYRLGRKELPGFFTDNVLNRWLLKLSLFFCNYFVKRTRSGWGWGGSGAHAATP